MGIMDVFFPLVWKKASYGSQNTKIDYCMKNTGSVLP